MSTAKPRGRVWDRTQKKRIDLGYFDTKEERDLAVAQAKLEISRGQKPKIIEDRTRGGELFATFAERTLLDRKRRVTLNTWSNYNGMLQRWIIPTFGEMKLRDIKPRDVDRWFNTVLPVDSPSNGQRYSVLSLIMNRAVVMDEIDSNPCKVEKVSATKSKRRPTWSMKDFHVLHEAAATDQERAFLWLLGVSGCRVGEALALNVEDIDLTTGEVTIKSHMVGTTRMEGTKAHPDQVRVLALTQQALEAVAVHVGSSKRVGDQPLFVHSRGGRMHYDFARRMFKSLRESRGLEAMTIHDLRHLALTTYGQHGATLADIMKRGGHSDMRTALRYQHSSRERDRELVKAMEVAYS